MIDARTASRKRRATIDRRVALFDSRLLARCFQYEVDVDAGELFVRHPDKVEPVAVVDLVTMQLTSADELYRAGAALVVEHVRRAEKLGARSKRETRYE